MFKVLENGKMPTRGSKYSACVDLYSSHDVVIGAGETSVVGLGVCIDMSDRVKNQMVGEWIIEHPNTFTDYDEVFDTIMSSHYLQLNPRSSLRAKGLISNTGIIDLDYEDEIEIIIHNPIQNVFPDERKDGSLETFCKTDDMFTIAKGLQINKGDRIAQITLLEHKSYLFGIESNDVRDGGLGSTGI